MEGKRYNRDKEFIIPDGYFEKLNREIKNATCNKPVKQKKVFTLSRVARIMSYAAMITLVVTIATHIMTGIIENYKSTATAENIDYSDYIDNMLASYPIDEYTFYCYLTEEE